VPRPLDTEFNGVPPNGTHNTPSEPTTPVREQQPLTGPQAPHSGRMAPLRAVQNSRTDRRQPVDEKDRERAHRP